MINLTLEEHIGALKSVNMANNVGRKENESSCIKAIAMLKNVTSYARA